MVELRVLGPTELLRDGVPVDLGSRKQRMLVAALALYGGRTVAVDALIDLLWPDEPPATVGGTLQVYVAGVRRAFEPDRPARTSPRLLVTVAPGYALRLAADTVDAARFEAVVASTHRKLGSLSGPSPLPGRPDLTGDGLEHVVAALNESIALWRGIAYLELGDAPQAVAERVRLEELRLVAIEDRAVARLALGEHATLAAELEALTSEHPLRERLWVLRVLALVASHRQADALQALRHVRHVLAEELGLDPGAALRELETAVLRQDPAILWRRPADETRRHATSVRPEPESAASAPPPNLVEEGDVAVAGPELREWPLVGRDTERAALERLLVAAADGVPQFAVLVGEPGIGKTRLAGDLCARAGANGIAALVGRCSQDEGAPPLWPWVGVLRALVTAVPAGDLPAAVRADLAELTNRLALTSTQPSTVEDVGLVGHLGDADVTGFQTWDAVGQLLVAASAAQPLLVVLDDLQWADRASLRLLRHLVETIDRGRLLFVLTRRHRPEPAGALAEVGEELGRRRALRLDLTGLPVAAAAALVEAATGRAPSPDEAAALHDRTEGNPFYLVELARLALSPRVFNGVGGMRVPVAVTDVVAQRVARLPEPTQDLLRTAAVIGRQFDLALLAAAAARDEESALDDLDAALAAGLIAEEQMVDQFRFAHAVTRDAVYAQLSSARRARRHAAVASALEAQPRHAPSPSAAARHWLAAGPAHTARAWRTAAAAAQQARLLYAHEDAAALLAAALEAQRADPSATSVDRYDLLLARADACRACADREGLDSALADAIRQADELGDVERCARAAVGTTEGVLWQVRPYGHVEHDVVRALQRSLRALAPADSVLRCQALLVLATELYYAEAPRHRDALVDEGLAMARRIADPALLTWACQTAFLATTRPGTAAHRLRLTDEAVQVSVASGDRVREAYARTLRATACCETGRISDMRAEVRRARELATELRLGYPLVALGWLEVPWLAMQGRFDEAEALAQRTLDLTRHTSMPHGKEGAAAGLMSLRLWQGRTDEAVQALQKVSGNSPLPMGGALQMLLVRSGQIDEARARHADEGIALGDDDDWFTMFQLGAAAETTFALRLADQAAAVYQRLAPFAGQVCSAGANAARGPVDAFLALAAAATGELTIATRHADKALELCGQWEIPLVTKWLNDQRERGGF